MKMMMLMGWACLVWTVCVFVVCAATALGYVTIVNYGAGMVCVLSTMVTGVAAFVFVAESIEQERKR